MSLTNFQKERLDTIKKALTKQLKAIQINKLALLAEHSKEVERLHDGLEIQFNNYLDNVTQYLEAKNKFKETHVIENIDGWIKTKVSLKQNVQDLHAAVFREKKQEVLVPDAQGKCQVHLVESSKQKELQAKADEVGKQIEGAECQIKLWTEKSLLFKIEEEMIKVKTQVFKTDCLALIGSVRPIFEHHGNWRDFFNSLVSLISAISHVFLSLHKKTTAEEILSKIEYNIDVAIKKAEQIDLSDAEYYGLIENPSFLAL